MKEEDLLADLGPPVLFLLAGVVFLVGWVRTGQAIYLGGTVLLGAVSGYLWYRMRKLYLQ